MLKLKNASIIFNEGTVNERKSLNDVSLELKEGEFVTVIGSNGAGKSTLMNAISGTYPLTSGTIEIAGKDVTRLKEFQRAKYIGRLFQNPLSGTAPNMTIAENLGLAYCRGKSRSLGKGINKKDLVLFKEKLATLNLGLEDRMDTPVGLLSGGQRQALTLMMATIVIPSLLLLDEHTAALDPKTAEQVMTITKKIIDEHKITTLMITHNVQNALDYGNRTIVLSQGRLIFDLQGEERANMSIEKLMKMYSSAAGDSFSDKMLLD